MSRTNLPRSNAHRRYSSLFFNFAEPTMAIHFSKSDRNDMNIKARISCLCEKYDEGKPSAMNRVTLKGSDACAGGARCFKHKGTEPAASRTARHGSLVPFSLPIRLHRMKMK